MNPDPGAPGPVPADWTPVVEDRDDTVTAVAARALHGLLDAPGPPPGPGDDVPPLWHWLAFLPDAAQAELGPDGHPRLGGFLPPLALPRRMWAGGRLELPGALTVAGPARRTSVVSDVTAKSGRTGELVFVEVTHRMTGGATGSPQAVIEVQDLVYRAAEGPGPTPAAAPATPPRPDDAEDRSWVWRLDLSTEPTRLFRFSALTYNAHRIHYDRAYATGVEGYPGLVVHGPLQAIGLAELCRRHAAGRHVATFAFRARTPAFDGQAVRLRGRPSPDGRSAELTAFDHHGAATMTATVTFSGA